MALKKKIKKKNDALKSISRHRCFLYVHYYEDQDILILLAASMVR